MCSITQFVLEAISKGVPIEGYAHRSCEGTYSDGTLIKQPDEEQYISCFDKSIRNIVLVSDDPKELEAVSAFYRQNEEANGVIKEIRFLHWREDIHRPDHHMKDAGEALSDVLKSVETVIFDDVVVWIDDKWHDNIFRHAPNMKRLTIRGGQLATVWPINWLQKSYPKLESLEWYGYGVPAAEEVKSFLELNPNVKHVSLSSTYMELNMKIDELFFHSFVFDDIPNLTTLKAFGDVQNVKLHLGIWGITNENTELVSLQPNLVGLYISDTIDEDVTSKMGAFENLQCLWIKVTRLPKNYKALVAKIPNLCEMFLDQITDDCEFKTIHGMILATVGRLPKLTKLYLRGSEKTLKKIDFAAVHQERMKLKGATFLKIFIELLCPLNVFRLNRTNRYFDSMEINPIASEPPNNPFFLDIFHQLAEKNYSDDYGWECI